MKVVRNNFTRGGVVLFIIWGLFQITVGVGGAVSFYRAGPAEMFSSYGEVISPNDLPPSLEMAAHIALNFSIILAGYGLLAIWMAIHIWRGVRIALWVNVVMLGIADTAFVVALMIPGYIPLGQGIFGPLLFLAAFGLTYYGFRKLDEDTALEKVTAGWVPMDRRQRPRE